MKHREPSPETLDRFKRAFKRWLEEGCPPLHHRWQREHGFMFGYDPRRSPGGKRWEVRA
mgnify:FL=1